MQWSIKSSAYIATRLLSSVNSNPENSCLLEYAHAYASLAIACYLCDLFFWWWVHKIHIHHPLHQKALKKEYFVHFINTKTCKKERREEISLKKENDEVRRLLTGNSCFASLALSRFSATERCSILATNVHIFRTVVYCKAEFNICTSLLLQWVLLLGDDKKKKTKTGNVTVEKSNSNA